LKTFFPYADKTNLRFAHLSVANMGCVAHFIDRVKHRAPITYFVGVFQGVFKCAKTCACSLFATAAHRAKACRCFKAHFFMGGLKIHSLFLRWSIGVLSKYDIPVRRASNFCKIKGLV